ncbi:O-fucosyltransferase 7-like [Silene latifolia]|uniref:O-fucosyltransferase 7-like n=1 Tax=Silene latifolia TaxID=37657 RepID=UPI003D7784D1
MGDFQRGSLAERDIEQASSANVVIVRLNLEVRKVIRAAKSDSRLANNHLPSDIQKLRCRACYEVLRFPPKIEAMGERTKGYCPLTPKEVGMFLSSLGYPSNTPIYITVGEIYGGESRIADLQSRYPILMSKEKLASDEELTPFANHASQMAALDYIVSVESDVFIPTHLGNMARAVEGYRRYLGHRKTISPDRKSLEIPHGSYNSSVLFKNSIPTHYLLCSWYIKLPFQTEGLSAFGY